jgi:mannose-6-phosphate isomerase-like protein (cupin superfamily)
LEITVTFATEESAPISQLLYELKYSPGMQNFNRRTLLAAFGVVSFTTLVRAQTKPRPRGIVAKPGENRSPNVRLPGQKTDCKVTSEDSGGACSIFGLVVPTHSGPPLHVHHREDEWYYVLAGEFIFEVGDEKFNLPTGSSIWAPREAKHRWANSGATDGNLILTCLPGGFEKFFEELGKFPSLNSPDPEEMHKIHELHAKFGMELLGPPIFS